VKIAIRAETPADRDGVRSVNLSAFPKAVEADLVDRLRISCPDAVSLVAVDGVQVVGNILFTPAVLETGMPQITGVALGPMSVLPQYQGRGIGSSLLELGLALLIRRACPFVVVLGHPGYYPRFGFVPGATRGIQCPWSGIAPEVFMVLILDEKVMADRAGVARYRPEFDSAL
jgi:putative acetyltransferase